MAELLKLWHAEHAKFSRLLNLLEAQVNAFHADQSPDYELMTDIVDYLMQYADAYHHRREDVGFARLTEKDPTARTVVNRLLQEHRVISEAGRELRHRLQEAASDAMMPRGAVEAAASTYLVYYRHHIEKEETDVLRRIERLFDDTDWQMISRDLAADADPLIGDAGAGNDRFRALRQRIMRDSHLPR